MINKTILVFTSSILSSLIFAKTFADTPSHSTTISVLTQEATNSHPDHNLIYDPYFSPYAGANNLIAGHEMLSGTKFDQWSMFYRYSKTPLAKVARVSELIFVWQPINYFAMVAQHEVFGHGYRIRNLDIQKACVTNYKFGTPPPYGVGGGATEYRWNPSKTTAFERLGITTGGVEATAIFANKIRLNWLKDGQVNPRQSSLYTLSQQDITNYILRSKKGDMGDISYYINELSLTYRQSHLDLQSLKKQALVNFLDPFTYYSLFAEYKYIVDGAPGPLPMIPIGSYKYLPSARIGFTPFGPEYYVENFLLKDDKPIYFYARAGKFAGMKYAGVGIEYPQLLEIGSIPIGCKLDLWTQPNVNFRNLGYSCTNLEQYGGISPIRNSRLGIAASLIVEKKAWSHGKIFVQCGWKTPGFVPGEELNASPIVRVGITFW